MASPCRAAWSVFLLAAMPACTLYTQPIGDDSPPEDDEPPVAQCGAGYSTGELVASGRARPIVLAADDAHVYWLDSGYLDELDNPIGAAIWRAPTNGGAAAPFVDPLGGLATALAVDGTHVYWSTTSGIFRAAKTGGPPETVVDGITASDLAIAGGRVFWIRSDATGAVALDGAEPVSLEGPEKALYFSIATDGVEVYWGTGNAVLRAPVAGGSLEPVVTRIGDALALTPDHVLLVENSDPDETKLARIDRTSGDSINLAAVAAANPELALAPDGEVYFSYGRQCDWIARAPSEPGEATVVVETRETISAILATDTHVWWASEGDPLGATGAIHRTAR